MNTSALPRSGGDWLVRTTSPDHVFSRHAVGDDVTMAVGTAREFLRREVEPALPRLEAKNWDEARRLLGQAGELGLLGVDVPESMGGFGLGAAASSLVNECMGHVASFATCFGAQSGLALLPLVWFGSSEQRHAYVPGLLAGDLVGAYCLSEAQAGSDALAAQTTATPTGDGHWRLSGEKLWITNGGFADLFVVFARTSARRLTAFLVERGWAGVSPGNEEHKMGLHGSSTTPVILSDVLVPDSHRLGAEGAGAHIAFTVLNYGRFKLASLCVGAMQAGLVEAMTHAAGRQQFGSPLLSFGLVRHMLMTMAVDLLAVDSALYRVAGLIDDTTHRHEGTDEAASLAAFEEFAVEASLLKVAASDAAWRALDCGVQIHGGSGFVRDHAIERLFRDARVNRIFEGTNEINRLLVPSLLWKRAARGGPDVITAARLAHAEVFGHHASADAPSSPSAEETVGRLKTLAVALMHEAFSETAPSMGEPQAVTAAVSDVLRTVFLAESLVLRTRRTSSSDAHRMAARVHLDEASRLVRQWARLVLVESSSSHELQNRLRAADNYTTCAPVSLVDAAREITDAVRRRPGAWL